MKSESEYKNELIEKLNRYHPEWQDGDLESTTWKVPQIL